jgi:isovaleryl-CoA dehydrogenase
MISNTTPMLDLALGESADAIRESVRGFTGNEIAPLAAEIDRSDVFPRQLWPKLGELGVHGITVEEEYGGLGLGYLEHCVAMEEISRGSASVGLSYGAHSNLCINQIRRNGSEAQKRRYLPKLATGEWLAAYALTEPGSGSDALGAKTVAERQGDGSFRLTGTKQFITNAGFADLFTVFAKVDGDKFTAFLVERTSPGLSTGPEEKKLGIKGSSTRQLVLDGTPVPADAVLGQVGQGHKIAFNILNWRVTSSPAVYGNFLPWFDERGVRSLRSESSVERSIQRSMSCLSRA